MAALRVTDPGVSATLRFRGAGDAGTAGRPGDRTAAEEGRGGVALAACGVSLLDTAGTGLGAGRVCTVVGWGGAGEG